jgi:hypothetical protein
MITYENLADRKVLPLGRDLDAAREAYSRGDVNAMIAAHDGLAGAQEAHAGVSIELISILGMSFLLSFAPERSLLFSARSGSF